MIVRQRSAKLALNFALVSEGKVESKRKPKDTRMLSGWVKQGRRVSGPGVVQ